jgi:tRNA(Arg) A34 adenosine deaminase TadA
MSKRDQKILEDLFTLASDVKNNQLAHRAHLAACLVHRNKIVAYGINRMKTHPFQAQFGRNADAIYWHSETQCIHNAIRKFGEDFLSTCSLYIARSKLVKGQEVIGLAKPCPGCTNAIIKYKIPKVVYTNNYEDCPDGFSYSTMMF